LINGEWYAYFLDLQANSPNPIIGDHKNITSELFYWSPDLPELVAKQAHMIKTWFDMPSNHHLKQLIKFPLKNSNHRTAYENIAKSIIYPDYDQSTWQTSKPTGSFANEMDHWFHTNLKDTVLYNTWQAGFKFLTNKINSKYFIKHLGESDGLVLNNSPLYYLGPENTQQIAIPAMINRDYQNKQTIDTVVNKKLVKIDV
jgi:hypothetical protein